MWLLRNFLFYFMIVLVFELSAANHLNGFETPYSKIIFWSCAALLFLVMAAKTRLKWTGIFTLNRNAGEYAFQWTHGLSHSFMSYTRLFYFTEVIVSLVFGLLFLYFDTRTSIYSGLLLFNALEGTYFIYSNTKNERFKIAINENAVVHNARGVYVIPFKNLKSIEFKYNEFFFIYENGETLTLNSNVVDETSLEILKQRVLDKAKSKGIFYTDKLNPL